MNDPYSVLGLSPSATDEQVRETYRRLATQYSDSSYTADPLNNVADSRMQALNEAFDQIMAQRRTGGNSAEAGDAAQSAGPAETAYADVHSTSGGTGLYADIRSSIRSGDILGAEQKLMGIESSQRGAEWNFLMGSVCQSKGWLDDARRYFSAANSAEPANAEYAAAYRAINNDRQQGGTTFNPYASQNGRSSSDCLSDDACSTACQMMCLYQLCSSCCCGGRR